MKRLFALFLTLATAGLSYGQVAHWVLHPKYDEVKAYGNGMFRVLKDDGKYAIYNSDEEEKYVADSITDYSDGYAVVVDKSTHRVIEYLDSRADKHSFTQKSYIDGKRQIVVDSDYELVSDEGRLSDGYIFLRGIMSGQYYLVNAQSGVHHGPFASVSAFSGGFANVIAYVDDLKMKDEYRTYFCAKTEKIEVLKQEINPRDIDFLSAPTKDQALICVDKKFYVFHFDTRLLEEVQDSVLKKKPVAVKAQSHELLLQEAEDGFILNPAPEHNMVIKFDNQMHLKSIVYPSGYERMFEIEQPQKIVIESKISGVREGDRYALYYNGELLLPQQFEAVDPISEDMALVKRRDKWGVIRVDPRENFVIKVNDNKPLLFPHEFVQAPIVLLLPTTIKHTDVESLVAKDDDLCELKVENRSGQDGVQVNTVRYNGCEFYITDDITDEQISVTYDFVINYDGLISKDYSVDVVEWFDKSLYRATVSNQEFKDGILTIDINIDYSGDAKHKYTVEVLPSPDDETIGRRTDQITPYQYRAQLWGFTGSLNYEIEVGEENCPTVSFPGVYLTKAQKSQERVLEQTTVKQPTVKKRNSGRPSPRPKAQPEQKKFRQF